MYVEQLAESVKGTVLYVAADNLGAHTLAGFQESFAADLFCRFCMCKQDNIQDKEVRSGLHQPRMCKRLYMAILWPGIMV